MLGELALIADTHRLTGADAEIDTDVLRLNRKLFRRILEEYPELAHDARIASPRICGRSAHRGTGAAFAGSPFPASAERIGMGS